MSRAFKSFRAGLIRQVLDVIMLRYMRERGYLAGYEFLTWMTENYGMHVSAGTVYSRLYGLERKGYVKGEWVERRRQFTLTTEGRAMIEDVLEEPTAEQLLTLLLEKKVGE